MKKLHISLLSVLLALLVYLPDSFSQDCFYATASSVNATNGAQVCTDVSVHGFVDVSGMQFSFVWDPNILNFNEVQNINLPPGASQFGEVLVDAGILTFFWVDPASGHDLPDRTQVFSVCFDVVGNAGQISDVTFSDAATNIEIIDSQLEQIEFNAIGGLIGVDVAPLDQIRIAGCEKSVNCGTDFELVVEGGVDPLTYTWVGPNGFTSSTKDLTGIGTGTYNVTVVDDNGLSATESFYLGGLVPAITAVDIKNIECSGFNNGGVDLTIEGGVLPYTILWSNGSPFEDISGLPPGTYSVEIMDDAGCTLRDTFEVLSNDPIELESITVDCESDAGGDGFVTIQVTGGSGNYSFDWSFGPSTSTGVFGNLSAGNYDVSVTDEFNCPYLVIPFAVSGGIVDAADVEVCEGEGTMLSINAPQGEVFAWSPATFLSCTDCPNPIVTATSDIEYYISVIDSSGCLDNDTMMVTVINDCVWPGDTDIDKEVSHYDLLNIGLGVGETGPARVGATLEWKAQQADDWNTQTPVSNVNYKYIDTNGDGVIDVSDTMAIAMNWGLMHNFGNGNDPVSGGPVLRINAPDTLLDNMAVSLPIELGDASNPVTDVYGLAFTIKYDPAVIAPGSANVALTGSWLGTLGSNLIMMQRVDEATGSIDVAITGMDGVNRSGFGQIGVLNLYLRTVNGTQVTTLDIQDEKLISNVEGDVIVNTPATTITIIDMIASTHQLNLTPSLRLYPNPTSSVFYIEPGEAVIKSVELFDLSGKQVQILKSSIDQKTIFVPENMTGSFVVRIKTDEGTVVKKLVLIP